MASYKVINTTVKPVKAHPRTGQDLRNATERVGHNVKFITDSGKEVIVERHRPRIVDSINEGLLRLQRGGFVRIEQIEDVTEILKKHSFKSNEALLSPDPAVQELISAHPASTKRTAKAVAMGEDTHSQKSGSEMEGAVNPDGDPNFLVKTSDILKKKNKKETPVAVEAPFES